MRFLITTFNLWQVVPTPTKLLVTVIILDGCWRGMESMISSLVIAGAHVYDAIHRRRS